MIDESLQIEHRYGYSTEANIFAGNDGLFLSSFIYVAQIAFADKNIKLSLLAIVE